MQVEDIRALSAIRLEHAEECLVKAYLAQRLSEEGWVGQLWTLFGLYFCQRLRETARKHLKCRPQKRRNTAVCLRLQVITFGAWYPSSPVCRTIYGERKRCPPRKARIYALFCCPEADIFLYKTEDDICCFWG